MPKAKFRSAWDDPNVKDALKEGRLPNDIALICCGGCYNYGYFNEGSHFTCSVKGCEWSITGEVLEEAIENGDVITLNDLENGEDILGNYILGSPTAALSKGDTAL